MSSPASPREPYSTHPLRKAVRVQTTGSGTHNLLKRDFRASEPNLKWLTDLTESHIPAGTVYLSPVIDCFDGMVVSWTVGTNPTANLVNEMLDLAMGMLKRNERPHDPFGQGLPLSLAWLDREDREGWNDEIHVEEGVLSGQLRM